MKLKKSHNLLAIIGTSMIAVASASSAATITQNFDSTAVGSAPPTGWSVIGAGGSNTFEVAATGNPTNAALMDAGGANANGTRDDQPGVYFVNQGAGFNANQDFSGSFDFYLTNVGNYDALRFLVGDIQTGLGTTAGDHIMVNLQDNSFGWGSQILDANATGAPIPSQGALFSLAQADSGRTVTWAPTDVWTTVDVNWTAATGTISLSWLNGTTDSVISASGYSFTEDEVFIGFGAVNSPVRIDNINFSGTAIPEPSAALLGGLGLLALLRRRR